MLTVDVKFTGQDKLNKKLRELSAIKANTKIGFFANSKYPDGTHVAYVAYLNEMGIHNPRRPFMRRTVRRNLKKWVNGIRHNIKYGGLSRSNVLNAYRKAGIVAVGDVKKTIQSWEPGGNSPATVENKARRTITKGDNQRRKAGDRTWRQRWETASVFDKSLNNPEQVLIDTGRMIASVAYEVEG